MLYCMVYHDSHELAHYFFIQSALNMKIPATYPYSELVYPLVPEEALKVLPGVFSHPEVG